MLLTTSQKKIMKSLGWGNPPMRFDQLAKAAGLTRRGTMTLIEGMEALNLLAITRDSGVFVELTFLGHRIKEHQAL